LRLASDVICVEDTTAVGVDAFHPTVAHFVICIKFRVFLVRLRVIVRLSFDIYFIIYVFDFDTCYDRVLIPFKKV